MTPFEDNKNEIIYHIINSLLAGGLVFLGSLTGGEITWQGAGAAFLAAAVVCITKFKEYWSTQENEYLHKFNKMVAFI